VKVSFLKNISLLILFFGAAVSIKGQNDKSFYNGLFYLTNYMTSDEYLQFKKVHSDIESVDHIYEYALKYFNNDLSETFLCLTFTLIPFNKVQMKIPFIGTKFTVPLPSPSQSIYNEKRKNTPKLIFFDSPRDDFGDKDKLAHFFGNAFLSYSIPLFNISDFMGIFVEYFEEGFFPGGGYDYRDLVANHIGKLFGTMVKNKKDIKPSEALKIYQTLYIRVYP
jgi:hypothetical protein